MKKTTYKLIKAIKYVLRYDSKLKKFHCFKQARETKKKLETKECKKKSPSEPKKKHTENTKNQRSIENPINPPELIAFTAFPSRNKTQLICYLIKTSIIAQFRPSP